MLFTYRQIKHRTSLASRGRRQHSTLHPYNYGSFSTVPNQLNIFPSLLSVHSISSVSSVSLSGSTVRRPAQCVERRSPLSHPCGRTATRAPTCSGTDAFLNLVIFLDLMLVICFFKGFRSSSGRVVREGSKRDN